MLTATYLLIKKRALFLLPVVLFLSSCGTIRKSSSTHSTAKSEISETKKLETKYALLLNVPASEISNMKLYRFLDEWMEVPYKYAGKTKSGVDCSGFTEILVKEIFGKTISGSSADIFNSCKEIGLSKLEEGDLVFFKINSDHISHVGVYLMNHKFAHATVKAGVTISDLDSDYYHKYFFTGGRLK